MKSENLQAALEEIESAPNAMQGDREMCLAAGMDDYIAKPIRVEELVNALLKTSRRK